MTPIKVLFLGTPEFSKNCVEKLSQNSQFKIQAVLTKPDIPSGRGLKKRASPVKMWAEAKNIPVFTPKTFQDEAQIKFIKNFDIDIVLIISYGLIIPDYFLNWFPDRVVNVHTSLLPRWRGAAPVPHCLLAGDKVTGITLQKVIQKLDAGDIIHQIQIPILPHMNSIDIYNQMESLTQSLLIEILPLYLKGKIKTLSQDELKTTYAPKIQKSQLKIKWTWSAVKILNSIRAFASEGGMYAFYQGKRIKIFQAEMSLKEGDAGLVLDYNKEKGLLVACGEKSLYLKEVQLEGKKKQKIQEFILGCMIRKGQKFE